MYRVKIVCLQTRIKKSPNISKTQTERRGGRGEGTRDCEAIGEQKN